MGKRIKKRITPYPQRLPNGMYCGEEYLFTQQPAHERAPQRAVIQTKTRERTPSQQPPAELGFFKSVT